jgi:hypothetical protein
LATISSTQRGGEPTQQPEQPTPQRLVLRLGTNPLRREQNRAELRAFINTYQQPAHEAPDNNSAFRGRLQSRLQQQRVTSAQITHRQSVIERLSKSQLQLRRTLNNHIRNFDGDISRTLSAISLVMKGSTLTRYAAALKAQHPDRAHELTPYINYGRKMAATVRGRPVQAPRFNMSDFAGLVRNQPCLIRDALILLFASASRAADLQHFDPTQVQSQGGRVWRILMAVTEEEDGELHAPKSDRFATKRITKWIPQHSLIQLHPTWPSYRALYSVMKQIGCTPHSIRGTAIQILEDWGYPEEAIACLTCHAKKTSVAHYSSLSVNDPGARLALEMSHRLLTLLQAAMNPTSHSPSTTGTNPPSS